MGFYAPAELIDDAKAHGVVFLPIDVNHSSWDYTLHDEGKKYRSVRMGFRAIDGIREDEMLLLIAGRIQPYASGRELLNPSFLAFS